MHNDGLPCSPACLRNQDPILAELRRRLPPEARVLEVGSGTGQHAIHMARHLPGLHWQPTERAASLEALVARWTLEGREGLAPAARVAEPLVLEVGQGPWPDGPYDAVFTANTLHIMPAAAMPHLLSGSAGVLLDGGLLLIYGPFRYGDDHTAPSNIAFDAHLRSLDPLMGVRDAHALSLEAAARGLQLCCDVAMPANNRLLVLRKGRKVPAG